MNTLSIALAKEISPTNQGETNIKNRNWHQRINLMLEKNTNYLTWQPA